MERIRNSVWDMFFYWIYRGWTHATFTAFDAVQAEFHCEKLMSGFTNVKKMEKKRFPFHWFGIRKIMQINIEWKTCENTEYRLRKTNTTTNQKTRKNALSNLSNWEKMNTTFFMFFFFHFFAHWNVRRLKGKFDFLILIFVCHLVFILHLTKIQLCTEQNGLVYGLFDTIRGAGNFVMLQWDFERFIVVILIIWQQSMCLSEGKEGE